VVAAAVVVVAVVVVVVVATVVEVVAAVVVVAAVLAVVAIVVDGTVEAVATVSPNAVDSSVTPEDVQPATMKMARADMRVLTPELYAQEARQHKDLPPLSTALATRSWVVDRVEVRQPFVEPASRPRTK
jgi:hypothetical protein